ncbi:Hypothetical predicted protein [Marmota monax]|uniref:Uncharacterized protein n=1 Tax=Marmota monax TaxID=9995 RepID=A0A5E4CMZ1_MARMO|nr:hypothetical protein GHT09_000397 [Marmota monax]VTJ82282.1 Hypothetical predicted protein [Marmota monax]
MRKESRPTREAFHPKLSIAPHTSQNLPVSTTEQERERNPGGGSAGFSRNDNDAFLAGGSEGSEPSVAVLGGPRLAHSFHTRLLASKLIPRWSGSLWMMSFQKEKKMEITNYAAY